MNTKILSQLYLGIGVVELLTHLVPTMSSLHYAVKPLLMLVLIAWVYVARKNKRDKQDIFLLVSLFFSWLGDIALMFSSPLHFMLGLGSFLIAHILYIVVFRQFKGENYLQKAPYWLIPMLLYGIVLLYVIYPNLKEMLIPVVIYACTIVTMIAFAFNTKLKISATAFAFLLAGALSFMISDSIIALNKFAYPFQLAPFFIMLLYILGQYGIIVGYLKAKNSEQ